MSEMTAALGPAQLAGLEERLRPAQGNGSPDHGRAEDVEEVRWMLISCTWASDLPTACVHQ
ncbi:hypothetical protein BN2476_2270003 [Paraburkholderia piptadeniae]|uniref:Uncharacterized protein n=1 Tax=Paraburkholderia piptadeniae TaxID=1701573 RepID=A0A1N7SXU8_9BURK|nr:hypothetical protein BN2476_2270003 [Paraburkholderia piptadeniae]